MPDVKVGESYYLDYVNTCRPYQGEPVTIMKIITDGGQVNLEITFHNHPEWATKWANVNQITKPVFHITTVPKFTSPAEAEAWLDANAR